jgi:hypothetical protein
MKRRWLIAIALVGLASPVLRAQDGADPFAELDDLSDESTAETPKSASSSTPSSDAAGGDSLDSELSNADLDQELADPDSSAESSDNKSKSSAKEQKTADTGSKTDTATNADKAAGDEAAGTADAGADALDDSLSGDAGDNLDDQLDQAISDADSNNGATSGGDEKKDAKADANKDKAPQTADDSMQEDELDSELADKLDEPDKAAPQKNDASQDGVKDLLTPSDTDVGASKSAPTNEPGDVPSDVTDLENDLDGTAPSKPTSLPPALRENVSAAGTPDLQSSFDPSDAFARVPIRPQMSDKTWQKWAGPNLEKDYHLRRGDTLWGISDRLFGNPFLWPKVWQLNAYITNANVVDPGMELQFVPGNPNSAPIIALTNGTKGSQSLEFVETTQKLGFIDQLELILKAQLRSSDPPFKYFLLDELPKAQAKLPAQEDEGRIFFISGDEFPMKDLSDGVYSVVRGTDLGRNRGPKPFKAYKLAWLGTVKVSGGRAKVTRSFREMEEGDMLVSEDFAVSPLSISEEDLGEKESKAARFVSIDDGFDMFNPAYTIVGIRFSSADTGPQPGALLTFVDNGKAIGTGLMIHRSGRYGTLWVAESTREISPSDKIR